MLFTFKDRKGDNSGKYVEKLWGKGCSSNSFHVLKVKENELFKEQKTVIKKRQKCPCVRNETSFLQQSHYLTLTFSHCYQDSQRFTAGIFVLVNTTMEFFNASVLCLNIRFHPQGQNKFMLLITSKTMSLLLNKQILFFFFIRN